MTRKTFRYLAGAYLLSLLLVWLGVSLVGGEEGPPAAQTLSQPSEDVQVIEVIEKEWKLIPNNLTLKAGKVRFILKNEGTKIHDFQVSREGFDKKAKRVGVGRTRTFEVTLEPGEYVFFCPISGHRGKGMEGTLTVQP